MVKRVFAWQTDSAGCFYYRLYLPLSHLSRDDWLVTWGQPEADIHSYDVVIGQRIAGPNDLWRNLCRNPNVFAVYDIDDDLLNIDPDNTVPYQIYAPLRDETITNIMMADLVTVSTAKLGAYLAQFNPNVVVLENCVTSELTQRIKPQSPDGGLTIGWAGSMFHQQDWHGVPEELNRFFASMPSAAFHTIGADYTRGQVMTRYTPWSTMDRYYASLDFDIGIAPVKMSPFNERKSWIKLLEYAALGIPAVASNVGQYPEWIDHGVNGFLIDHVGELVDALHAMSDDVLLASMSEMARRKARQYTIEKQVHRWADAYSGK